jgi:phosphate:Na+ symporter
MVVLNICGGIALILFGIRFLRKGLDRVFGHRLHAWLENTGQHPWKAAAAGGLFGTLAPSSTAQTLLTLQLLKSGRLAPQSMLVFLLAANAGISVTVQLIAIRVFDYYSVLLLAGIVGFQFLRSETLRGIGQSLLGLGFLFLAMSIISKSAQEMAREREFLTVLSILSDHRLLVMVFAAGFTFVAQSSTATIGLGLALAATGQVSLQMLIPIVLGANLGIGLTSLAAGYSTLEGRALAWMNIALKGLLIAATLFFFHPLLGWVQNTPGDVSRQAANFHTGFGLIAVLVALVFSRPIGAVIARLVRLNASSAEGLGRAATHLDESALGTPVFALANATRETLRLADEVKSMMESAFTALKTHNTELAKRIQQHDDRVDELHSAIKQYLSKLPVDSLNPRDSHFQFGLLNFGSQLEAIADVVDKVVCAAVHKEALKPTPLPQPEASEVEEFYTRVLQRFGTAISVLASRDRELAQQFLAEGDRLKEWCIEAQKRHYQRLTAGSEPSAHETSERYIDILNALRRINGLLNTIGHTFTLRSDPAQNG